MCAQHRSAIVVPMLNEVNALSIRADISNLIKLLPMHAREGIRDVPAAHNPPDFSMPQVPKHSMNNGRSFLSTSARNESHGVFVPILGYRGPHASEPLFTDRIK
eukprot:6626334-Heterocapsa_arctica.AAC.1